jgi:hypothetical protein
VTLEEQKVEALRALEASPPRSRSGRAPRASRPEGCEPCGTCPACRRDAANRAGAKALRADVKRLRKLLEDARWEFSTGLAAVGEDEEKINPHWRHIRRLTARIERALSKGK